jgi:hypothetical protein
MEPALNSVLMHYTQEENFEKRQDIKDASR